jgi:hypothetical protein
MEQFFGEEKEEHEKVVLFHFNGTRTVRKKISHC